MSKRDGEAAYDVIVIGAGISGLICSCYLAKAGYKVLLVEQHDKPGGYFTSFKRKGFYFDAAAHSFGNFREGGHVRKIFTEIGLTQLIHIQRFDPSDVIIAPDFRLTFSSDGQATIDGLSKTFPHEKDNIVRFFNFIMSPDQTEMIKLRDKTFSFLLHSFFKDEKLIAAFALPVFGNGGLPPSRMHAFSGTKIFSEFIIDGGYYPEGGIQALPNALDALIKKYGGEVSYKKLVKKIIVENDTVKGIELDHGERLKARNIVAACDMTQTFKNLLGQNVVTDEIIGDIERLTPSISTFILYMGIDGELRFLPHPGTNMWHLPHYDLDEMYENIFKNDFTASGMYMLRVSPDQKTILAFTGAAFNTKQFWKENKKKVVSDFLKKIGAIIPGIHEHLAYIEAATPQTLYRYTLNHDGAAFGWSKTAEQSFIRKTTSIKGLYLSGHWTSIAFGMPGACYSGYETAKRILRMTK